MNGGPIGENCKSAPSPDGGVIRAYDKLVQDASFIVRSGDLFDALNAKGGFPCPENHQELYRKNFGQHARGASIEIAIGYQGVAARFCTPRQSH